MKDGPVRAAVKALALACFSFDLALSRGLGRLRRPPDFRLGGACQGCGACCETPMIRTHFAVFALRSLRWCFLAWQRHVNRFELVAADRASRTWTFRCHHFDPVSRRCDSYGTRPGMCRDYPRALLASSDPQLLPGCGFRAVARNAAALRASLATADLPAERRAELERRLHVRD